MHSVGKSAVRQFVCTVGPHGEFMAEESDLDRTESATPKRLEQAREEGQVARSRELTTFALLVTGFGGLYAMAGTVSANFEAVFRTAFTFNRAAAFEPGMMQQRLSLLGFHGAITILPILATCMLVALLSPMVLGGFMVSGKPLGFNFGRMNPISGLGKMFSRPKPDDPGLRVCQVDADRRRRDTW